MAEINGGKFGEGMSTAAINKLLVAELSKHGVSGSDLRWISATLGITIDGTQGGSIADSATRNNALNESDKKEFDERLAKCTTEEEKQALIREFLKRSGVQETDIYTGDVLYSIDQKGNFYVSDAPEMTAENFIKLTSTTAGGVIIALGAATGGALAGEYIIVKLASGAVVKVAATPTVITGIAQSRINIATKATRFTPLNNNGNPVSAGWKHVVDGHFNTIVGNNRSVFTVSQETVKEILQRSSTVQIPVSPTQLEGSFTRVVNTGQIIGTASLNQGGQPTTWIKIITDKAGNLITTFPVSAP